MIKLIEILKQIKEEEFIPGVWGDENNNYSINKLVNLVKNRNPTELSIDSVIEKNSDLETKEGNFKDNIQNPTNLFYKRTMDANTQYPIMVSEEGWIVDGSHRVAKLKWEGKKYIKAHKISKSDLEKAKITDEEELKKSSNITYK